MSFVLLSDAVDCEGIVMCSQMHGLVFTNERGEPRSNLTTWQDHRVLLPHPSSQGTCFDVLRQLICARFQKDYRLCPTSEDTLLGLLALALAFTGRAASVEQATILLCEAYGGGGIT